MFTWICPKCGKEVPPAYSECPNCTGQEAAPAPEKTAVPAEAPRPAAAPPPQPVASAARPAARRNGMPGWLMSVLFAAVFVVVLGTGYALLRTQKKEEPPRPAAAPLQAPVPAAQTPAVQANPVLRNLEITALRLTEDKQQKAFLQFVVVNHSSADLGDVSAKANLLAVSSKPDSAPVTTFSFKTNLGPYESKEFKVPVETKLRVYELPDWQFLRAELVP